MSHSFTFRSHLMQQFTAAARNQSRPPIVLSSHMGSSSGSSCTNNPTAYSNINDDYECSSSHNNNNECMDRESYSTTTTSNLNMNQHVHHHGLHPINNINRLDNVGYNQRKLFHHPSIFSNSTCTSTTVPNYTTSASSLIKSPNVDTKSFATKSSSVNSNDDKDGVFCNSTSDTIHQSFDYSTLQSPQQQDDNNSDKLKPNYNPILHSSDTITARQFQYMLQSRRTTSNFLPLSDLVIPHISQQPQQHISNRIQDAITRAIQCAIQAPNHHRTEPYTFKRIMNNHNHHDNLQSSTTHNSVNSHSTAKQLADIAYHVSLYNASLQSNSNKTQEEMIQTATKKRQKWSSTVGAYIVALVGGQPDQINNNHSSRNNDTNNNDQFLYETLPWNPPSSERQLEDYAATCAAIQNILLSLHSENIGAKWATGPIIRCRAFRNLVGCNDHDLVAGLIMVGVSNKGSSSKVRKLRRELMGDILQDL